MNNIFKFRAWDKLNHRILHWRYDADEILTAFPYDAGDEHTDNYQIQQFIGVLDLEGNEIYEGDILLNHNCYEEYCSPAVVVRTKYEYCGWSLAYKTKEKNEELRHRINGIDVFEEFQVMNKGQYLIIGNVYENEELIK